MRRAHSEEDCLLPDLTQSPAWPALTNTCSQAAVCFGPDLFKWWDGNLALWESTPSGSEQCNHEPLRGGTRMQSLRSLWQSVLLRLLRSMFPNTAKNADITMHFPEDFAGDHS